MSLTHEISDILIPANGGTADKPKVLLHPLLSGSIDPETTDNLRHSHSP
jgi:hypothetical protein